MSEALVTCVVPVFNGERFLGDCLRSVLSQSYPALDVIVVDDGSTDGTPAVIDTFGDRVRVVRQANRGEAAARNAGVQASRGAFLAFLDADDLWEPAKIARQVAALQADPAIDLCFTNFQNFWMPEVAGEQHGVTSRAEQPFAAWSICTLVARREVFDRFGPFDEALRRVPNMTWFIRAAGLGARIEVLPETLMRRRLHQHNASRMSEVLNHGEFLPMLKAWRDYRQRIARPS